MPQHLTRRHVVTIGKNQKIELEFYSLRLLSDVVNRRWEAVKMWEWFGWTQKPIFNLPRMKGRKLAYRWYCADEIELHYDLAIVHGVIATNKRVSMKNFFRELTAEREAMMRQFMEGTRIPKEKLDRKFIVRVYETRRRVELLELMETEKEMLKRARKKAREDLCISWQKVRDRFDKEE